MNEIPPRFTTHTAGEGPTQALPGNRLQLVLAGVAGGIVVGIVILILALAGVFGGDTTVVEQGGGFATTTTSGGKVPTVNAVYRDVKSGVVNVKSDITRQSDSPFGGTQQGTATGSGFVVGKDGYILTNDHVVSGASKVTVQFGDQASVSAKVIGVDPSNDLAVLKVNVPKSQLHPLPLGDSSKAEVGNPVIAIGNPFGLDRTVTTGIVSALQREIDAPNGFTIDNVIQTDAAINPGNSGGPLLDSSGKVIGINSQIATSGSSEGNVGIGFAVPINTAKKVLPQLEKNGKVQYAFLGVSTTPLTPDIADRLNLGGATKGALVATVTPGGPAAKAGLHGGDIDAVVGGEQIKLGGDLIVKIDDTPINTSDDVAATVLHHKAGDTVQVTVVRAGKKKTFSVKLGTRPSKVSTGQSQVQPQIP